MSDTPQNTFERINKCLGDLGCSKAENVDQKFIDDLGLDSLDQVELVMMVEDEFSITIPDEAVENGKLDTVKQLVEFVDQAVAAGK